MSTDANRRVHSNSPDASPAVECDPLRPLPFVFLGKNLLESVRLSLGRFPVHEYGVMKDNKLLAASVTPKRAHLFES
jgi:hypothetical protein